MKLLTVAVPCYNSEAYMSHCIDTLLSAGDEIEIIIVNDGSKDGTGAIADRYQAEHPDIIRVIHQENGGHGEGVNQGIRNATGLYFKVVDSDDWVNEEAFLALLSRIRSMVESGNLIDMYVANYVYEHVEDGSQYVMRYKSRFPVEEVCTWNDVRAFGAAQILMMHSVYFRTQVLRDCGVVLPKHTFYVDNLYMYQPLPYVKSLYYMDLDVYRYFIGRQDQSVTAENMIKRLDQQFRVTRMMMAAYTKKEIDAMDKGLQRYLYHELSMMIIICSAYTKVSRDPQRLEEYHAFLKELKEMEPKLYNRVRYFTSSAMTNLPGPLGRGLVRIGYRVARKKIKFS